MDGREEALFSPRAQFGLDTFAFHILFPSLTIGLAWLLLYFRLRYACAGEMRGAAAWLAISAPGPRCSRSPSPSGVVSGITMSFQFGTNWPGYMLKVGNVAGPLLAYEVLTASSSRRPSLR